MSEILDVKTVITNLVTADYHGIKYKKELLTELVTNPALLEKVREELTHE